MTFSATAVPQNPSRPRNFVYPLCPPRVPGFSLLPPSFQESGPPGPRAIFRHWQSASSFPRSSFKSLKIANTSPDVRVVARPLDPGPGDLPNPGIKPESLMSPVPSTVQLHPEHIWKLMEERMPVAGSQLPSAASGYLPCFSQHENTGQRKRRRSGDG